MTCGSFVENLDCSMNLWRIEGLLLLCSHLLHSGLNCCHPGFYSYFNHVDTSKNQDDNDFQLSKTSVIVIVMRFLVELATDVCTAL